MMLYMPYSLSERQWRAFDIREPLLIGMSGGKTSAFQLRLFLDRLGGAITGQRCVPFANTGDEDERTLKFVERVSLEWGVPIVWLEYRFEPFPANLLADPDFCDHRRRQAADRKDKGLREAVALRMDEVGFPEQAQSIRRGRECLNGRHDFAVVNYATASRHKEPYQAMLLARESYRQMVKGLLGVVPCPPQRLCTGELKVKTMYRYIARLWGCEHKDSYNVALALRADEHQRVDSTLARSIDGGVPHFPLADAGLTAQDVATFWSQQPFQLGLHSYEGNCRLCFMKKQSALETLLRRDPDEADWWIEWERRTGDHFRRDRDSYAILKYQAKHQLQLFDEPGDLETVITCEGGYCSD
jgi:hypothetical protein